MERDDPCHLASERYNVHTVPDSYVRIKVSLYLSFSLCSLCFYLGRNTMVFFELKDLDYCIIIKYLTSVYTKVINHAEIGRGLCQVNAVSEKLEYLTNAESDADIDIPKQ